eukprot:TRINITY_DN3593_c0_g2_i1.p2 TRINITY_DN3593_c0_g2~~TRINITY_DN3593_c0_g2_i1.p2  ORF type:complete len:371 (+),score=105.07 TRINITY_DN3593_c0_g2_i1:74-1114(+)
MRAAAPCALRAVALQRPPRRRVLRAGRRAASAPAELELQLWDGAYIRGLRWAPESGAARRCHVLALHGWVDNAMTWAEVAPVLSAAGCEVAALDMPGHGRSSHPADGGGYVRPELYAACAAEAARLLGWERYSLLGHSLGGGVVLGLASALPEVVPRVAAVEPGWVVRSDKAAAPALRNFVLRRLAGEGGGERVPRSGFPSLGEAAAARQRAAGRWPGGQTLSDEAALRLASRGCAHADSGAAPEGADHGPVRTTHDPRLHHSLPWYPTHAMVESVLRTVTSPALVVSGDKGWPRNEAWNRKLEALREGCGGKLRHVTLPGSHHLHADPHTSGAVSHLLADFFRGE